MLVLILCSRAEAQTGTDSLFSLKQCVETAIANNIDVQQGGLQLKADEINWKQSKLNLLPGLNGSIGHGVNQGRSIDPFTNGYINQNISFAGYGLSSGVTLFNGLALQNTIKQNSFTYQASKMDWQQTKDNLTINVILAYLQVLSNSDQLGQISKQVELSKKQVERLEILNRSGAIPPSQLYDLKGQLSGDEVALSNARNAVESSRIELCRLMNIPYRNSMQIQRIDPAFFAEKYTGTPADIYAAAMGEFALIKSVDLKRESAEKAVKAARGYMYPTLSLNGNLNSNYSSAAQQSYLVNSANVASDDYVMVNGNPEPVFKKQNNYRLEKIGYGDQLQNNLFTSVSLNLSIPLFNSLRARNRVKLAQLSLKNTELIAGATKIRLQQDIEQAYSNMTTAFDSYKSLLDQVNAYEESFKAAEIRFNEGVGTSIDYLTAKNNYDRASSNMITAKYDYYLRTRILDYYKGNLSW